MSNFLVFVIATVLMTVGAVGVKAQSSVADHSGTWKLDVSKSKLDERSRIDSMTMTVEQAAAELVVSTVTKRTAPETGAGRRRGGNRQSGRMERSGGFAGDGKFTYTLDGKETTAEQASQLGSVKVKLVAITIGDGLRLRVTREVNILMDKISLSTIEDWTLSADGMTLTVLSRPKHRVVRISPH